MMAGAADASDVVNRTCISAGRELRPRSAFDVYSYNDLWGHGPQEQRLLAANYSSAYAIGRDFQPLAFVNMTVRHALTLM